MRAHFVQGVSKTRGGCGTLSQSRSSHAPLLERLALTSTNLGGLGAEPPASLAIRSLVFRKKSHMTPKKSLQNNTAAGLKNQTPSG